MEDVRPDIPADQQERIHAINTCEFARLMGMTIAEVGGPENRVRIVMTGEGMLNGFGTLHGGAIFSLADQAFGIAANLDGIGQVAVSACIKYLAPVTGRIEAVAKKVEENAYVSMYRVEVYSESRLVAIFHGTGYKVYQ